MHIDIYTQTHPSPHHHPHTPLPLLLFYVQSKSGAVVNMWGYPVLYFFEEHDLRLLVGKGLL